MKNNSVSNNNFDCNWSAPFYEKAGLIELNQELIKPEFLFNWSFVTCLYNEPVLVDHFVITFSDKETLLKFAQSFLDFGAKIVEGPEIFPVEFCEQSTNIPEDLWLHLLTLLMPSGGLLVLDAPHAANDQLNRFLKERGESAVHHVAVRVDDIHNAVNHWQEKGFKPLSKKPLDYGSLNQWFLRNSAGQIIELIKRQPENNATFDCQNIAGLRLSEVS